MRCDVAARRYGDYFRFSLAVVCFEPQAIAAVNPSNLLFGHAHRDLKPSAGKLQQWLSGGYQVARLDALRLHHAIEGSANLRVCDAGARRRRLRFGESALGLGHVQLALRRRAFAQQCRDPALVRLGIGECCLCAMELRDQIIIVQSYQ